MADLLRVGVALDGAGWRPGARSSGGGPFDPGWWAALAAEAERGLLDFVSIEDGLALADGGPRPEALPMAGALLGSTSRIGLLPTVPALGTDPLRTAAALETLHRAAPGRVGWRIQAPRRSETGNFGGGTIPEARAEDLADTGALGARLDAAADLVAGVRALGAGAEGPRPPVAALAHAELPYRFAARCADLVFVTPRGRDDAAAIVARVRDAEGREGRVGTPMPVHADLVVSFGAGRGWTSDAHVFTGPAGELVELLTRWQDAGIDGFRLRPGTLPDDLVTITRTVLPELARRGRFRTSYGDGPLLGLPDPPLVRSAAWDGADATALRERLTEELRERYRDRLDAAPGRRLEPEAGATAERVVFTGVAYSADGTPVGHVALRRLGDDLELKRMYVVPERRGAGVSRALLTAAERVARSLRAPRIVMQTGDRQPEAVRMYERAGYLRIPVFPPYDRMEGSVCLAKPVPAEPVPAKPVPAKPVSG